jgi:hypothetical protein
MTATALSLEAAGRIKRECLSVLARLAEQADRSAAEGAAGFFGPLADSLRRRAELIEQDLAVFGIFGEFKRGKSTLLNALLGREVSPVRVTPETAVLVEVRYGPTPSAEIEFLDGRTEAIDVARLAEFTGRKTNPENVKRVARARVRVPNEYLRRGLVVVDTPGLQDVGRIYSNIAEEFVRKADAAILVLTYPAVSLSELSFIAEAAAHLHKIFIVLNLWPEFWAQRETIRAEAAERLIERAKHQAGPAGVDRHADLTPERLKIHVVNAQAAFEASAAGDPAARAASLLPDFEAAFDRFLTAGKGLLVLTAGLRCAVANLSALLGFLELEAASLTEGGAKLDKHLADIAAERKRADEGTAALAAEIEHRCNELAVATARDKQEAVHAARSALDGALSEPAASPEALRSRAEQHVQAFNRRMAEINAGVEREVGELYRRVSEHLSKTMLEGFAAAGRPVTRLGGLLESLPAPQDAAELAAGPLARAVQGGAMMAGGLLGGMGLATLMAALSPFLPFAVPMGAILGALAGLAGGKPLARFLFRDRAMAAVRHDVRGRIDSLSQAAGEVEGRTNEFFISVSRTLADEVRRWVESYFRQLETVLRSGEAVRGPTAERRRGRLTEQIAGLRALEERLLELTAAVRQMHEQAVA